jgi:hypothetical protein
MKAKKECIAISPDHLACPFSSLWKNILKMKNYYIILYSPKELRKEKCSHCT